MPGACCFSLRPSPLICKVSEKAATIFPSWLAAHCVRTLRPKTKAAKAGKLTWVILSDPKGTAQSCVRRGQSFLRRRKDGTPRMQVLLGRDFDWIYLLAERILDRSEEAANAFLVALKKTYCLRRQWLPASLVALHLLKERKQSLQISFLLRAQPIQVPNG
jgi:hypothetical protein